MKGFLALQFQIFEEGSSDSGTWKFGNWVTGGSFLWGRGSQPAKRVMLPEMEMLGGFKTQFFHLSGTWEFWDWPAKKMCSCLLKFSLDFNPGLLACFLAASECRGHSLASSCFSPGRFHRSEGVGLCDIRQAPFSHGVLIMQSSCSKSLVLQNMNAYLLSCPLPESFRLDSCPCQTLGDSDG